MPELKVEFHPFPKTLTDTFQRHFPGYNEGLVKSQPGNFVMPPIYAKNAEKIYNMKLRSDDVWLFTFPKCGKLLK